MRSDIVPGGVFPDYELPDHTDTVHKLSERQRDDPMILTLARGDYCPKEHQQHLELAALQAKLAVAYTSIATIATDEHHLRQEFRASVDAHGRSSPTPVASCSRTSPSRSTPTPSTTR
jgi:peroxiredoxin